MKLREVGSVTTDKQAQEHCKKMILTNRLNQKLFQVYGLISKEYWMLIHTRNICKDVWICTKIYY